MHFSDEQVLLLSIAMLLIGVVYGHLRGAWTLAQSLLLRAREPSPYKLGGKFVYVMEEIDFNRMSRQALQWEMSRGATDAEKPRTSLDKLKSLSWEVVNMDMNSRSRELLRWVRESKEPTTDEVVDWFAWECTQVAWHAVGLETGLYPIDTQKWDGSLRSPFCTAMERRRREVQDRNIRLMGRMQDDKIEPRNLADRLKEDFREAGVDIDQIYTLPEEVKGADCWGATGPGVPPTGDLSRGDPTQFVTQPPKDAIWYNEHSPKADLGPKADPSQELDDRIAAFNERTEDAAVQRAVDREEHGDRARQDDARSRDPYGSSMLNEDVSRAIRSVADGGIDLGKVRRASERGTLAGEPSFPGAPQDVPDTMHGNWFVISEAGEFYGPFSSRTQAEEKAKGSTLAAWSLGQSSPDEFLTLCSQGKGHNGDELPPRTEPRKPACDVSVRKDDGGQWYVLLESKNYAERSNSFEYVGPFDTLDLARTWRKDHGYGPKNLIMQISDVKSALGPRDVATPPRFP